MDKEMGPLVSSCIIDTNILIYHLAGVLTDQAEAVLADALKSGSYISIITRIELLGWRKEIVRMIIPTATVLLYGSVARGTQDEESDYDVLILTDAPLSTKEEDAVTDAVYDLELEQGIVVSTLFYTKDFWAAPLAQVLPFHQRVRQTGMVI